MNFRFDVYIHTPTDAAEADKLGQILATVGKILHNQEKMMSLIDDLLDKADQTLAEVQRNAVLGDSIVALVTANAQQIRDLKAALDAAGTDPVKLQALSDTMDQIAAASIADSTKTAEAVAANTEAAPTP